MKKIILTTSLLIGIFVIVRAQQQPLYTQYILNPFIINPALAGIESYWDVKLSYRNQWSGITGGPQTSYLTIQGPLKKIQYNKATVSTISPPDTKKRIKTNHWIQYRSAIAHAGLGFTFFNDKTGPLNRYAINATYAYHIGLSPKTSISAGLAGGIQSVNLNTSLLDFGVTSPIDPSIATSGVISEMKPDVSVGLWLYSAFYFLGASVQNVIPLKMHYSKDNNENVFFVPHVLVSGGYKFFLDDKFNFLPSAMVRIVNNSPINVDVNLKLQYQEMAWLGVSYRQGQSFATMLGFNINSTLNIGYSYDITFSNLRHVTGPTHEVVIGMLLGNRNKVRCPRDFW